MEGKNLAGSFKKTLEVPLNLPLLLLQGHEEKLHRKLSMRGLWGGEKALFYGVNQLSPGSTSAS